ncbi:lysosomal-trafficking regulator [Chironomus tepperi]|uniref:lysosomal-trafficking regulator n=1 Tax=Chironomus tepperi TaxID=113505 RepID=UPI00391FB99C
MEESWKFEYLLTKYINTMKVEWFELLFFEYYNNPTELKKFILQKKKFKHLSQALRTHLLELISIDKNLHVPENEQIIYLRYYFTKAIGGRIIVFLNDLHLETKISDPLLSKTLMKTFPTLKWDYDMSMPILPKVSRNELIDIYKAIKIKDPENLIRNSRARKLEDRYFELEDPGDIGSEEFITDEYKQFIEQFYISPPEFAIKLINILHKLTLEEYDGFYGVIQYVELKSVSYYTIHFALKNLISLSKDLIFNESDQTVIKKKLMFLLFGSYSNIKPLISKPMYLIYEKILTIFENERDIEITCGLVCFLISIFRETRSAKEKIDFDKFILTGHQNLLEQIERISSDKQLLHYILRKLIINIKLINNPISAHQSTSEVSSSRDSTSHQLSTNHHLNLNIASHCIFERLLIDSIVYIKSYKQLLIVLKYLLKNGICCCNVTIDTIRVFLRSSLIPSFYLKFIEKRINRDLFKVAKMDLCNYCREKIWSIEFRREYLNLFKTEFERRDGYELHLLYHHLMNCQKIMPKHFLRDFIVDIIVPRFKDAKSKFFSDPDNNQYFKDICCFCLQLMNENAAIVIEALSDDIISDLGDCSLVPAFSIYSSMILRHGLEYFYNIDEKADLLQKIKSVLFTNTHSLISELLDIYNQVGLPKITYQCEPKASTSDACEFEIVDEHNLLIRENLSKLDVLFLSSVHWNILSDLVAKHRSFKADFLANICNNFNEDILFSIAYHAINTILLRRDIAINPTITDRKKCQNDDKSNHLEVNTRCDYLTPVIVNEYDINYDFIISRSYKLFEICQNFSDKLQSESRKENPFCMTYNTARDKKVIFNTKSIHRDNFLSENALEDAQKTQRALDIKDHKDNDIYSYQHWFHQLLTNFGEFESKNVREAITKFVYRFIHPEDELQEIYRLNAIREISNSIGTKYLSSIAKSCFDVCFRLWRNQKLCTRMSTAIQELKLLLLQDEWITHKDSLFDALELLIKVAEMKVKNVNQILMTNIEPMPQIDPNYFDDLDISSVKIHSSDSDDEKFDADNETETYFSADENYDADEEYYSTAAEEFESQTFSFNTISNFKNTNEHICKLVIEILMNLSIRYLENRDQWDPEVMTSLMRRISCMNKYFGGSDFIIKGFSPVLSLNEAELEKLQKGILDLIGDLNSPEILKACFSLLTNNNVPVELIISRIEAICNQETFPKPFNSVKYPICQNKLDITITSACDRDITALINSYREFHTANDFCTPFTESSQIIPLNIFERNIWNSLGYTLSTWIELEEYQNSNHATSIHMLSFGTDKLVLTAYINSNGFFEFNVMKPNQNYGNKKANKNKSLHDNNDDTLNNPDQSNKENNKNNRNIKGIGSVLEDDRERNIRTRGSIKNGFRKSMSKEDSFSRRMETTKVSRKSTKCKVPYDRWTHICMSIRCSDSTITILITLNGIEHETIEIPVGDMINLEVNGKLQLLFIGSQTSCSEDEFEKTLKYSMSNVLLFQTTLDPNVIACLFCLGPDCDSFMPCELMQLMSLRGYIDISKIINRTSLSGINYDLMSKLQSNILLTHNFIKASYATVYMKQDYGVRTGIYNFGKIAKASKLDSLARSIYFSGGLSSMLFLFARTVELTEDPETQSSALYIFLRSAYSNNYLNAEFEQRNLFNLVAHVFKHGNCYRGPGMLKAILDVIYGGSMFHKRSKEDEYSINENSGLNIQNGSLLIKLLNHFNIFQTSNSSETKTLNIFFKSIITTVRDSHPCKAANLQCLRDHGFYEKLMQFCKTHLASTASTMRINSETACMLVELIKMMNRNPPTMWSIREIQKLLILLHHPSESFVTHDRSKFNFILSSHKPSKLNRSNQTISLKYFNFSTKIRSANAPVTSPQSPQSPSPSMSSGTGNNTEPQTSAQIAAQNPYGQSATLVTHSDSELMKMVRKGPIKKRFKRTKKFDELDQSQIHEIRKALKTEIKKKAKSESPPLIKVDRKRLQSTPKKKNLLQRTSTIIDQPIGLECALDPNIVENFKHSLTLTNSNISLVEVVQDNEGINILQEQLFKMLTDSIKNLDPLRIQTELPECLKIESFIMFANHQDANVRAALINLIHTIINCQSADLVNSYQKANYWIHLGNQLSIWPVNSNMFQACLDWICGGMLMIDDIAEGAPIEIQYKPAFRVLISMLPSMTNDIELLNNAIKFFNCVMTDNFQYLMENGLVAALIKSLINIREVGYFNCVGRTLEVIAVKSFNTMGVMQILWELLYGLSYAERQNKSIREVHLKILRMLLNLCLERQDRRGSRAGDMRFVYTIRKELGNLTASEIKTRFNLVLDRSIQFILSWEIVDKLKVFEIDFAMYLIDMYFSGIMQGSLVLWSLNPGVCSDLKLFTAHKLLANLVVDPNFSIPDIKMFKSLLFQFVNNNPDFFTEDQIKIFTRYCGTSITQQQQNWNWSMTASEKVENIRVNASMEQLSQIDKIIYKLEPLVQSCIDNAMRMTRDVIDIQNKERRRLMNQLKRTQEIDFYREWFELIQRMTHEDAPWYNEELYPTTFELDETEGPGRMRIRLKRAVLKIEERFFNDEFKFKAEYQKRKQLLDYLLNPKETERYSIRDQIIFTFNAKHLTMEQEIEGEIIITESQFIFLTNHNTHNNSIISNINDISEIWERRYQHKEVALEIFLKSNKSFFIIFESNYDRDIVNNFMSDKIDLKDSTKRVENLTQMWIDNKLTNFEYLMELNKLSGRNYNDIAQYPIFPWIINNFEGNELDLTIPETFRKLNKTISTQFEGTEEQYISYYNDLIAQMNDLQAYMRPYHYTSLYSNSGTVLHFLVRLPPFTSMFLHYQDNNFDIPDRTFHNLSTTYRLTSKESATDVKELIPEFFCLPDFLENQEGFNYGKRQTGEQVNDVKLPDWCGMSARNFVLIHRQAFESEYVRRHLNHWIDLIFGFKQKGKAAVEAINVFHFATYPEFHITSITDQVERSACETMVKTYGQVPKQIFMSPHKKSSISNEKLNDIRSVLRNVKGLKWGIYTGSPQLPKPRPIKLKKPIFCKQKNMKLILAEEYNTFLVVPDNCSIIQGNLPDTIELLLWKERDRIVRKKALDEKKKSKHLFSLPSCDPVTCCLTHIHYPHMWFGHLSGNISVYVRVDEPGEFRRVDKSTKSTLNNTALEDILDIKIGTSSASLMNVTSEYEINSKWMYPIILLRHEGEVLSIKMCVEFKIAVSIGIDGRAVIWDTEKIEYIRTIEPSCNTLRSQLTHVDISTTLGDILTVFKPKDDVYEDIDASSVEMSENSGDDFINVSMSIAGKSQLRLNNINGKYIKHIFQDGIVTATCFSFIKEGTGVNVIAAAFNDFTVRMFSTWNLDVVREIDTGCNSIIKGISFSTHHYLGLVTDSYVYLWGTDGLSNERPSIHDIVLVN